MARAHILVTPDAMNASTPAFAVSLPQSPWSHQGTTADKHATCKLTSTPVRPMLAPCRVDNHSRLYSLPRSPEDAFRRRLSRCDCAPNSSQNATTQESTNGSTGSRSGPTMRTVPMVRSSRKPGFGAAEELDLFLRTGGACRPNAKSASRRTQYAPIAELVSVDSVDNAKIIVHPAFDR